MNKRQFALSAAAFVVALALVSCEPLRGHAVEIDYEEQAGIYDYMAAGGENLGLIDFRLDDDSDGNRSVRVKIYALQSAMLAVQSQIYDNMDFSVAPASVSVSGSGGAALYRVQNDGSVKIVSYTALSTLGNTGTFISAPDFTFAVVSPDSYKTDINAYSGSVYRVRNYYYSGTRSSREIVGTGLAQSYPIDISTSSESLYFGFVNTIPTLNQVRFQGTSSANPCVIGGYAQSVDLPNSVIDTLTPWDYYNNILLPYIQNEFPDLPDLPDYLIFPDGFEEPEQPTTVPVEYPTLPGFDLALETNGTEPASDYNYNIPDLPGKDVAVPQFDFTQINPAEVMAPVAEGLKGIWQLIAMVLTEYGLFPYVGLAVFAAIVLMLLRLGK